MDHTALTNTDQRLFNDKYLSIKPTVAFKKQTEKMKWHAKLQLALRSQQETTCWYGTITAGLKNVPMCADIMAKTSRSFFFCYKCNLYQYLWP